MSLLEQQQLFARLLPSLLARAHELGFDVVLGEIQRSDEQAEIHALGQTGRERLARLVNALFPMLAQALLNNGLGTGIRMSVHRLKLAVDLMLFRDGKWLTATEDYQRLGEWWEKQHTLARWGGRWGDGGHFSLEWEGRK